ncbi:hypothetical protein C0J50_13659 [Silurus asotus]|uniref:Craniofacial development protein 2-like n=1 Tax=Silurus asotus TaxID=30991 RepID=A0AAD5FSP8_SILAS|nr:hypothetical protein C0J50_13659 [Silurus asotus]
MWLQGEEVEKVEEFRCPRSRSWFVDGGVAGHLLSQSSLLSVIPSLRAHNCQKFPRSESVEGFYYGVDGKRNGVGVILKEEYSKRVVEVKRLSDRMIIVKLEVEGMMINVIVCCEMEAKEKFWCQLDEVVDGVPRNGRLVIEADFNGHVGEGNRGDEEMMGWYGLKERNMEGKMVVDFAKRREIAVVNTYFKKKEDHSVMYKSGGRCTQDLDQQSDEKSRQEYKEMRQQVKRDVAKAKEKAYEELYERLDTKEGEKDLYRLATQRDQAGRDVLQVRAIKGGDGNVLTNEKSVMRRWRECFEKLLNKENEREGRLDGVEMVKQEVDSISKEEVRAAIKRSKSGKSVGPDDIPVEAWRCLGEIQWNF